MSKICTDSVRIDSILDRGIITEVLPHKSAFRELLLSGRKLRIYIGADATSSALHLSHAKNYMLLEEFRLLGHEVIVLFGDLTAQIGDPTDRDSVRARLSTEQVDKNIAHWLDQIRPLMDFEAADNPPRVVRNGSWLAALDLPALLELASQITVQRMLERDMFERRLAEQRPIHLHEFLYPLMQGFDSVALDVDVELCGTDQIFNALVGRTLLQRSNGREKFVVAVNLSANPITGELMSKSKGTGVFLDADPFGMFGQVMAQPDEMIRVLLTNNTRVPLAEIDRILDCQPPMEAKLFLAEEVTAVFFGRESACAARLRFDSQIRRREVPDQMPEMQVELMASRAFDLVRRCLSPERASNGEIRRLFSQGGIRVDGKSLRDPDAHIEIGPGVVLRVGKREFFRIIIKGE
jgi:tyrosyl-tRNA synthetase